MSTLASHSSLAAILGGLFALAGCSAAVPAPAQAPHAPEAATTVAPPYGSACVTIQRGVAGEVSDTRIAQSFPDANYGEAEATFAGAVGGAERDVLLGFSLANLPEGAVVTKATLTLHKSVCGGSGVEVHRVTAAWDEARTTWSSFARAFDPAIAAQVSAGIAGEPSAVTADVTSLVRAWTSGAEPNHGMLLRRALGSSAFATSEADVASERPRLEVCFIAHPDMTSTPSGAVAHR